MDWLKDVIVDILVTFFIAAAWWLADPWMWWVIAIYSALLVIAKGAVLWSDGLSRRAQNSQDTPEWFLHLLYGINVIILALAGWWILMTGWIVVWLLSYLSQRQTQ